MRVLCVGYCSRTAVAMPSLRTFFAPKFWPVWLGVGVTRLLVLLPWSAGQVTGRVLGAVLYRLMTARRRIAKQNIALCFDTLDAAQQKALVKATFVANSIGYIETFYTLWGQLPPLAQQGRVHIEGLDKLNNACQQPEGVLVLTAHFTSLDLAGALFNEYQPLVATYQRNNNPLLDTLINRGRGHLQGIIERKQTRQLVQSLKQGNTVWVAPDQDLGANRSVFAPFFGQPTATTTMVTRLVAMTKCRVIFYSHHRTDNGYRLTFTPLHAQLSGDPTADTALINSIIESHIKQYPEQYMWVHRRFKTRPHGADTVY